MLKELSKYVPFGFIALDICIFILFPFDTADATEKTITQLDAVVVSATKTKRSAFTVADSVSAVDANTIEHQQSANLGDIINHLANVDISSGPRAIGEDVSIRGLSNERILFLMDGARRNFSPAHQGRFFIDPDLLKQTEVLRGPGSALWGSGAVGGIISLTTKSAADLLKPDQTIGVNLKTGTQGANDESLLSGSLYGRGTEKFEYLIHTAVRDADDLETGGDTSIPHSAYESTTHLGKINWAINNNQSITASIQDYEQEGQTLTNPSAAESTTNPLVDRNTSQEDTALSYKFNDPNNNFFDLQATLYETNTEITEDLVTNGPRADITKFKTSGFDIRNHTKIGEHHLLTYGFDSYTDTSEARRNGLPRVSFPDGETKVTGFYIQDEIKINKNISLTPGIRTDDFESTSDDEIAEDQDDSETSVKLGISAQTTDWLSLHFTYGEAFRAPKVTELFVTGTHFGGGPFTNDFVANPNLKPEKAENTEISARMQWSDFQKDSVLQLKFTYFKNEVENFIDTEVCVTLFPGDTVTCNGLGGLLGFTTNSNVGKAELKGYEIESAYHFNRYSINVSYGETRGKDKDTGEFLNDIPADKWVIDFNIKSDNTRSRFGIRANLVDAQNRVSGLTPTTEGYDIFDIYATWQPSNAQWQNVRFNLGVDNVTDKQYRRHLATLDEAGRNLKFSASYKF